MRKLVCLRRVTCRAHQRLQLLAAANVRRRCLHRICEKSSAPRADLPAAPATRRSARPRAHAQVRLAIRNFIRRTRFAHMAQAIFRDAKVVSQSPHSACRASALPSAVSPLRHSVATTRPAFPQPPAMDGSRGYFAIAARYVSIASHNFPVSFLVRAQLQPVIFAAFLRLRHTNGRLMARR